MRSFHKGGEKKTIPYVLIHLAQTTATITFQVPSLQALFAALSISLIYGLGNYRDSLRKGEAFSYPMFLKTVLISLGAGAFMSATGLDPQTNYEYAVVFLSGNTVFMKYVDEFVNNVVTFSTTKTATARSILQS